MTFLMRLFMGVILLALVISFTACTTLPGKVLKQYPPDSLMQDCRTGALHFRNNQEITESVQSMAETIRLCNLDKAALREWSKD